MNRLTRILLAGMTAVMLASCNHNVSMLTEVHEDGSLDKTIVQESQSLNVNNIVGIDSANGWEVTWKALSESQSAAEGEKRLDNKDGRVSLHKHFASAAAANAELATPNDTLFRVTSTFEKRFRWFYTYIYYADTYHSLNRMAYPIDDFLTQEDYAFIDRLPAEGKPISKADSLYLEGLNHKLYDIYGVRAYFEEYYSSIAEIIRENQVGNAWLDTLRMHKKDLLEKLLNDSKEMEIDFVLNVVDSLLNIPLPADANQQLKIIMKPRERVVNFISTAHSGKYQHAINMPWNVIRTNADSVSGRSAFWSPPPIKFLVKDYTLYAEARQMNYWAVALSAALVAFSGYLLWRRR